MNPHLCRVALRPRGPLEVFDLALRLLRTDARAYLVLTALLVLPPWLLLSVGVWLAEGDPWSLLPALLVLPFLQAPITILSGRLLFAPGVGAGEALRETLRSTPAALAAILTESLAVLIGGALCGYGLAVTLPATLFVHEAALLERVGPGRGLRRSMRLAMAHPGTALVGAAGRLALTAWCVVVFEAAGQALVGFLLQLGQPFGAATSGHVTPYLVLGLLVAQPLHALWRLLLYVDVRTRTEGWDLQVGLRAAGLGT